MITDMKYSDIDQCIIVIQKSFETVASEFGITETNCPKHTSFIKAEDLHTQFMNGRPMFTFMEHNKIVGYFSLKLDRDGSYELQNVAVLPEYRHKGYGKEMVTFALNKVRELGSNKITIGIIEESTILKNWYSALGFIHIGTKKFEHLPFTVGYMEILI